MDCVRNRPEEVLYRLSNIAIGSGPLEGKNWLDEAWEVLAKVAIQDSLLLSKTGTHDLMIPRRR